MGLSFGASLAFHQSATSYSLGHGETTEVSHMYITVYSTEIPRNPLQLLASFRNLSLLIRDLCSLFILRRWPMTNVYVVYLL